MIIKQLRDSSEQLPMRLHTITALILVTALAACTNDAESNPTPSPTSTARAAPEVRATTPPTATPTSTAVATSPPTPTIETRPITGLFTDPRPTEPNHIRALGPIPASPFAAWNREDVILYDTATMTERNLGPGWVSIGGAFSPDGSYFAWTAGPPTNLSEVWLMDLSTGDYELLTSGIALRWLDDHTISGRQQYGSNERERFDIRTGEWTDADDVDPNLLPGSDSSEVAGWLLERLARSDYPAWTNRYRLTERTGARLPLEFDAYKAILAPAGTLFVATVPADARIPLPNAGPHIEAGTTNIFAVDPVTGVASYIATAEASAPGWSFDASEGYVAWMDGFCAESELASTMIYDRSSGELTQLDALLWFKLTPNGQLASGVFGASELIDIETLEYVAVLPENVADIAWSADYRYAAIGFQFGHGGPCG